MLVRQCFWNFFRLFRKNGSLGDGKRNILWGWPKRNFETHFGIMFRSFYQRSDTLRPLTITLQY